MPGDFERPDETVGVLLMPPDVELSEVSTAGLLEPNAEWTETARVNVRAALDKLLAEKNAEMIGYPPPADRLHPIEPRHIQLVKLHAAVGQSILLHTNLPPMALPTKPEFDWTLGDGVKALGQDFDARYALFVAARDSFSSPGRKILQLAAAVLGAYVSGGQQYGFASLVDLETGDIVWFNQMSSSFGDLRDAVQAESAADSLLDEFPL